MIPYPPHLRGGVIYECSLNKVKGAMLPQQICRALNAVPPTQINLLAVFVSTNESLFDLIEPFFFSKYYCDLTMTSHKFLTMCRKIVCFVCLFY